MKTISLASYTDKVKGAWLGKMVGVSMGIPTEFRFKNRIGEVSEVPAWYPDTINEAYIEDDLYVPVSIMQSLDRHGLNLTPRQLALDTYPLSFEFWGGHYHNFERGIAPPSSGSPSYANTPDSLSYAFGADYSGLIAPGLPNIPAKMADQYARLLVYGDGVFGGAFIGAMYTESLFTDNIKKIIESGLSVIPEESWLHMAVSDTVEWYGENPDDFTATWRNIMEKYFWDEKFNWIQWPYGGRLDGINLDTKINCSFITLALLYGGGDPDKTLEIAIRCGADSDCNPSNALGILFSTVGYEKIPDKFKSGLNTSAKFRYCGITFEETVDLTVRLGESVIIANGGKVGQPGGEPALSIPVTQPERLSYENSLTPSFTQTEHFTADEMNQMYKPALQDGSFEESWHSALYSPWAGSASENSWVGLDLRAGKAHSGDNNAYISNEGNGFAGVHQKRIKTEANTDYKLICFVKSSQGCPDGIVCVAKTEFDGGAVIASQQFESNGSYREIVLEFNSGANEVIDISVGYYGNGGNTYMLLDDFSLAKV